MQLATVTNIAKFYSPRKGKKGKVQEQGFVYSATSINNDELGPPRRFLCVKYKLRLDQFEPVYPFVSFS